MESVITPASSEPQANLLASINPLDECVKQGHLEALYEADGRHDPAHPFHALYTGLFIAEQQRKKKEARKAEILQIFLTWWKESYGMPVGTHAQMTHVAFAEHMEAANG